MAKRPIFTPNETNPLHVMVHDQEFKWHAGFALCQKQKSINSLHEGYKQTNPNARLIEISSKSSNPLGVKLSAFNLVSKQGRSVEALFQGSKVWENGGKRSEIYNMNSKEAKKYFEDKDLGELLGFELGGIEWGLEPKTMFYDYVYINTLLDNPKLADDVLNYDNFTDIEFNPLKSFSCQARSLALYVGLQRGEMLHVVKSADEFKQFCQKGGQAFFDFS